jgi:hypothetical protein
MKHLALIMVFFFLALFTYAEPINYQASVREVKAQVITLYQGKSETHEDITYCLYVGNDETRQIDRYLADAPEVGQFVLVHPVPEIAFKFTIRAKDRWYAMYTDMNQNPPIPIMTELLNEDTWKLVPNVEKNLLKALGEQNDDLIVISYNIPSKSVNVYFHPKHEKDRAFYEEKLKILVEYMAKVDLNSDLGLDAF